MRRAGRRCESARRSRTGPSEIRDSLLRHLGLISFVLPRAEFHRYLERLFQAGFGKRVMFGSDQMVWPQAIERAIEGVESAPSLSPDQKRDIFYGNAARFLRLSDAEVARRHGRRPDRTR
jgi:uncharacterized protein